MERIIELSRNNTESFQELFIEYQEPICKVQQSFWRRYHWYNFLNYQLTILRYRLCENGADVNLEKEEPEILLPAVINSGIRGSKSVRQRRIEITCENAFTVSRERRKNFRIKNNRRVALKCLKLNITSYCSLLAIMKAFSAKISNWTQI